MSREFSFLDLAEEVLKLEEVRLPLTDIEIWEKAKTKGIAEKTGTRGRTPWRTIGALLGKNIKNDPNSLFIAVPTKRQSFFLKSRKGELTEEIIKGAQASDFAEEGESRAGAGFKEGALHPLLAYFAQNNQEFWCCTKTIIHNKSTHKSLKEWLHPDMVGIYLPFEDMEEKVVDLQKIVSPDSVARFYSFELKRELTRGTYRESFFQAVSNSSWAHEGYLVAADISGDDEFYRELERLTNSFGIGIIHLNLPKFSDSEVLFPAKTRLSLDWETINKLYEVNEDFSGFIENVRSDFYGTRISSDGYDDILENPVDYIRDELNIKPIT